MRSTSLRVLGLLALALLLAACGRLLPTPQLDGSASTQGGVQQVSPLEPIEWADSGAMHDETPQAWFVEFNEPPGVERGRSSVQASERAAFRRAAAAEGLAVVERYDFTTLFNGLSIQVARRDVAKLARLPNVKAIWPVVSMSIPETQVGGSPELFTALAMTGADVAQNELGLSGAGVRVAVMDTGIDYLHPDLGGGFGPGYRVVAGWDFVGDTLNADPSSAGYNPVPAPDDDPMDCNGHGTHVAGIVGADGAVTGVAPGVSFGAYRVFGCAGSTTADIMLAAMERALADGMHVLNMSIGSAFQWPQYPTAVAASRLVNRGMVVVASIGNSGANGLYAAGAPGVGQKVIGVASFDNTYVSLSSFTISPDDTQIGYGPATAAPAPPTSGSLPMARTGTTTTVDDACAPLAAGALEGKAALIRRGTCPFHTKALNAQNAGAAAVVLYNNSAGRFSPTVAGTPAITIPVVAISDTEGALIDGRLAAGAVTMTWTDQLTTALNPTGNLISSFSSYGLAPDLSLKPDIAAPGGLIYSTYPLALGGYATVSGTSMAAPHVAGGVALLLEAHPRTPAAAMRTVLQNSAVPKNWAGNPGLGFLDNVHRQGAGMLDIVGSIQATSRVEPSRIATGESEAGPFSQTLRIENKGATSVMYTLTHVPALSTGANTFAPTFHTGFASVTFSSPSVTVPAGGSATVDVTIAANPALADRSLFGGYVVMTGDNGQVVRVPYGGIKGDYQSIQALTTPFGLPWLARLSGTSFGQELAGAVFTMQGDDVPFLLLQLAHPVRRLRVQVFTDQGRSAHRAYDLEYVGRNGTSGGYYVLPFDGITRNGNRVNTLPNGTYSMRVEVQKALGGNDPAHWETWTSPTFTIARP
jgi:minor extracellular serine protease Vpr